MINFKIQFSYREAGKSKPVFLTEMFSNDTADMAEALNNFKRNQESMGRTNILFYVCEQY